MTTFIWPQMPISTTGLATEAKQDVGNASLATIAAKDFATQTTLATVKSDTALLVAKDFSTSAKQDTTNTKLDSLIAKDYATAAKQDTGNASLATIAGKDFATAANQTTTNTKIDTLTTKTAGALVPFSHDYISYTSGATTDTYVYKTGGAGGTTVATVTLTYTDSTKATLSNVART